MGDEDETTTGAADEPPRRGRRPPARRPIWRRGWFWVAVIGVEVVVALVVSFAFERSTTEVDLAGGDITAFCAQAHAFRDQGLGQTDEGTNGGSVGDPGPFIVQRDGYRALVATAPTDLVVDLEDLADLYDEVIVTVNEIAERKASDPSYSGLLELTDELQRVGVEGKVAAARVNVVLRDQCAIVTGPTIPTSTVPPMTVVPGSRPS